MKKQKNNLRNIKLIFSLTFCFFVNSCHECYSDACWQKKERARFLGLSREQQKKEREECVNLDIPCYTYSDPTEEELKNQKEKK